MNKMKGVYVFMVILVLIIITGCGSNTNSNNGGSADDNTGSNDQIYKMKLAHTNPQGDPKDIAANKFAELVEEKTNGQVEIEVYPGGTLGDWREVIEGLGLGQNEIVIESVGTLDAYSELANIDAVPYIFRDYDHFMNAWNSDIGTEILDGIGEEGNFKLLGPQYRGARVVTSKEKFENLDELKGLDIRAPGIEVYIETWKRLGANPTPIALTEVYTALQQGTVSAQENPVIASYNFGFYDTCPYLVMTNHVYSADVFMFNDEYFDGLPADIKAGIEEAAAEAAEHRSEYVLEAEEEFVGKFEEEGVEVIYPELEPFRASFDGFVEEKFPYLEDFANQISEID